MTILTPEAQAQIRSQGFGFAGDIGGQPKKAYWTPDGRQIFAQAVMHEFIQKDKNGKVIASGVRDANLDRGWLTEKPLNPKPYCPHCDLWHDTAGEVAECGERRATQKKQWQAKAKAELAKNQPDNRLDTLEKDMADIKKMLKQLIGGKVG